MMPHRLLWLFALSLSLLSFSHAHAGYPQPQSLVQLREDFVNPDSKLWGINPFWWWEAEPITRERITWQMETLSSKGIKSLTILQRAPGHCDPAAFTNEWWELVNHALKEARRLDMRLFLSDHLGYGETGFMEGIITNLDDPGVWDIRCLRKLGGPGKEIDLSWGDAKVLGARAYPMIEGGVLNDAGSVDVEYLVEANQLTWQVPGEGGNWSVVVVLAETPMELDEHYVPFSEEASRLYIEQRLDDLESRIPKDMIGRELAGFFGDEHPHFPQYIYTDSIEAIYTEQNGDELARALPALFFDLGRDTIRYRTSYYNAAVEASERVYWRPVFEWCNQRGLEYGNDQAKRRNVTGQIDKYFDYVKTMRWYSAPGQDDPNDGPLGGRNFHGFKQAASIKELYGRTRVWNEAFYSSGVGIHPGNHLAWQTENAAYGANLYNPHNYFYSNRAATWTHTDGGWFWRQPYWEHYEAFSDYMTRMSMLGSLGRLQTDIAIHYPAVSIQAQTLTTKGKQKFREPGDANGFMAISEAFFFSHYDNLIIDDDKLLGSHIESTGELVSGSHRFSTLAFGPQSTIRISVLRKALEMVQHGGHVIFVGRLPNHSAEAGADDPQVKQLLEVLLGSVDGSEKVLKQHANGGSAAFFPIDFSALSRLGMLSKRQAGWYPKLYGVSGASKRGKPAFQKIRDQLAEVTAHLENRAEPNFVPLDSAQVIGFQREIAGQSVYMVQSLDSESVILDAVFEERGQPQLWDPWTGAMKTVDHYTSSADGTRIHLELKDNLAQFIVFDSSLQGTESDGVQYADPMIVDVPDNWSFALKPTLDNRWGDFRLPASESIPAVEVTRFRYREESLSEESQAWSATDHDDSEWQMVQAGVGPYWECAATEAPLTSPLDLDELNLDWRKVEFSKTHGVSKLVNFRGKILYALGDGVIMPDFISNAPKPYAVFRTYILSSEERKAGLRILLRQQEARLWVNGEEQVVEYGIGELPLIEGRNHVVIALKEPRNGQLYVTHERPVAASLELAQDPIVPALEDADWIREAGEPTWSPTKLKREFVLDSDPVDARVILTAFPDYRLMINGTEVLSNTRHYMHNGGSGTWLLPREANITPLLKRGRNLLEVEVALDQKQYFGDTRWRPDEKKLVLALAAKFQDGSMLNLLSDNGWKDSRVLRPFAETPSSKIILKNRAIGMTTPEYPLGIQRATPFLTCFEAQPPVVYDYRNAEARRVGWFRFDLPPGATRIQLSNDVDAQLWINGAKVGVRNGIAELPRVSAKPATAALRLEMEPGAYGGAAFKSPLRVSMQETAKMPIGDWQKLGLPIYSGIGTYQQTISISAEQLSGRMLLDLGTVGVSARVSINGEAVGIRMCEPYEYDLSDYLVAGENTIEVEVANTTAPFFSTTPLATRRKTFVPYSGLLGPVRLIYSAAK